jgi:hypothetical protein
MAQAWMQLIGLVLDLVGFSLILWEWVLAQLHELQMRTMADAEERQAEGFRNPQRLAPTTPDLQRHHEIMAAGCIRHARRRQDKAGAQFRGVRLAVFCCGALLVVAGFAAQRLGAWPGCCPPLGIAPGRNRFRTDRHLRKI